jgi:isochorismate synthase EntC
MNVTVGTGKSAKALDGEYSYQPDPKGGGAFVLSSPERVTYHFLLIDGVPLAGIWIDKQSAERDAETLRHLLAQKGGTNA